MAEAELSLIFPGREEDIQRSTGADGRHTLVLESHYIDDQKLEDLLKSKYGDNGNEVGLYVLTSGWY